MLGVIWVQTVCKGYQQATLVAKGLIRIEHIHNDEIEIPSLINFQII